jgi:hypothetical protein
MNWKIWKSNTVSLKERNLDEIMSICKILIVDDKNFPLIDILKASGWINTRRIKDVDSLEQSEIKESHILIVDIQGVGKKLKFKDEGLGLILAIKDKYPNKKLIVYSAEDQGKIQAFHSGLDVADKRLSKNSDPYQFQVVIENFAREAFSLNECVKRIQNQILIECGDSVESDKIIKNLNKIYLNKNYSVQNISQIFNLQNASNISSIIQLFLTAN